MTDENRVPFESTMPADGPAVPAALTLAARTLQLLVKKGLVSDEEAKTLLTEILEDFPMAQRPGIAAALESVFPGVLFPY